MNNITTKKILSATKIIVLGLVVAFGIQYIYAQTVIPFSPPPGAPTTCYTGYPGCDAPINVSTTTQTKAGSLILNTIGNQPFGLTVWGQSSFNTANVGTSAIQIIDGNQGAGKVLTSDPQGNGTWQTPTGGGGGYSLIATPDTLLNSGAIPTTWTTVNLGSGSGGLGIVPAGTTEVLLKGYAGCKDNGSGCIESILARATGSSLQKTVAYNRFVAPFNGGGNSTISDTTIVPVSSNYSIDYEQTLDYPTNELYVVGYIGPAPSSFNVSGTLCKITPSTATAGHAVTYTQTLSATGGVGPYSYLLHYPFITYAFGVPTGESCGVNGVGSNESGVYDPTSSSPCSISGTPNSGYIAVSSADGQSANVMCTE